MPATAVRNNNTFRVTIPVAGQQPYHLDMSLQRHAWAWIGSAAAKPMNSVLKGSITENQIQQDLVNVGNMILAKIGGAAPAGAAILQPSLADQINAIGRLPAAVTGAGAMAGAVNQATASTIFGDYTVPSQRTYRVDNTAIDFLNAANHCYPISGPGLWSGMDQLTFAGAASFRRLEEYVASKGNKSAEQIWHSLQSDPTAQGTPIYGAFTGARTNYAQMPAAGQALLVDAAGSTQAAISTKKWLDS